MARIARNISAIVFLVSVLLTPVRLHANTCYQYGFHVAGPYCEGQSSCSQLCLEQECFAYVGGIGGGEDCFWFCVDGAQDYCE